MDNREKMPLVRSIPNFNKCCTANGATEVWTIYQFIELPQKSKKSRHTRFKLNRKNVSMVIELKDKIID